MRGFRQFDAPVSVVVTIDKDLADDTVAHFDCGTATYGLVLAATSKGLGCVINGQGIMQSSVVREHPRGRSHHDLCGHGLAQRRVRRQRRRIAPNSQPRCRQLRGFRRIGTSLETRSKSGSVERESDAGREGRRPSRFTSRRPS